MVTFWDVSWSAVLPTNNNNLLLSAYHRKKQQHQQLRTTAAIFLHQIHHQCHPVPRSIHGLVNSFPTTIWIPWTKMTPATSSVVQPVPIIGPMYITWITVTTQPVYQMSRLWLNCHSIAFNWSNHCANTGRDRSAWRCTCRILRLSSFTASSRNPKHWDHVVTLDTTSCTRMDSIIRSTSWEMLHWLTSTRRTSFWRTLTSFPCTLCTVIYRSRSQRSVSLIGLHSLFLPLRHRDIVSISRGTKLN